MGFFLSGFEKSKNANIKLEYILLLYNENGKMKEMNGVKRKV